MPSRSGTNSVGPRLAGHGIGDAAFMNELAAPLRAALEEAEAAMRAYLSS